MFTQYKKGLKICVLGAGNVGATIAYTLTLDGVASEIVIVDINKEKAQGEALDIIQGTPFSSPVNVYAGDYPDAAGSDIVVVAVGMGRKPGMTRIDLAQTNVDIIKQVMPQISKYAPEAIYIVVSNPVDILTYVVTKISGLPQQQIIGSGTLLDSARLRSILASQMHVNPKNVHGYVFGEHGDTSMVPWSLMTICGIDIQNYPDYFHGASQPVKPDFESVEQEMRTAGSKVIGFKGATYYAISVTVSRICSALVQDAGTVHTISSMMTGQYGINDICLSLPFMIGASGIEGCLTPPLTPEEEAQLHKSAAALTEVKNKLSI